LINGRRMMWLGYLFSSEESYPCRKLMFTKPEGIRRVGRLSVRWLDSVESDLRDLGVRRWKESLWIGSNGKNIIKEAET
jgi:hypothetical protein